MHHQPVIHEFYAVVETKRGNDHSCQAPDALGPRPPRCPRVPAEERYELGMSPPLTLACFQRHQLHLAWKRAAAGGPVAPGGCEAAGAGPPASTRGPASAARLPPNLHASFEFPSTLTPPENGHLSVLNRRDGMKTTRMKSHVVY